MLLLFLLHSMGIALFRLTGAICRNETIASTGGVRYCRALRCKHAVLGSRSVALVWSGQAQSSTYYILTRCPAVASAGLRQLGDSQTFAAPPLAIFTRLPCCAGFLVSCHAAAGRLSALRWCAYIPAYRPAHKGIDRPVGGAYAAVSPSALRPFKVGY